MKCFVCGKEIKKYCGNHIYSCYKKNHGDVLEKKEIKYSHIVHNFPMLNSKEIVYKIYFEEMKSLPEIKTEFGIEYETFTFLLNYHGYQRRTLQETGKSEIRRQKYKATCIKNFGAEHNLAKESPYYEVRNHTVKQKYGVDNIFQAKFVSDVIHSDVFYLSRFGKTYKEAKRDEMKKVWENLSDDAKNEWLEKSIFSDKSLISLSKVNKFSSKLETFISSLLVEMNICFMSQVLLSRRNEKGKVESKRLYDFCIPSCNLIIEIQGKYWHASPLIYQPHDVLIQKDGEIKAEDIWEKDYSKMKLAVEQGFEIMYIWEEEIKNNSKEYMKSKLTEIINERIGKNKKH